MKFSFPVALALLLLSAFGAECAQSGFSTKQSEQIRTYIEKSKEASDQSLRAYENAHENGSIAARNHKSTGLAGFEASGSSFTAAEQKFLEARKAFDDAWIQLQLGLDRNDPAAVEEGVGRHNAGIKVYNEGVKLSNDARSAFDEAMNTSGTAQPEGGSTDEPDEPSGDFPYNDNTPTVAVLVLIATVATSLRAFKDRRLLDEFILHPWSIVNQKIRYYTLVTSGLIHADSSHLMFNAITFFFFAFPLERIAGHGRFFAIYFGSLLLSAIAVTVKHGKDVGYRALGASGAISGVLFSYILYRPMSRISVMLVPVGIPAPLFALLYVAYSYTMDRRRADNIGHDAHLWGALSGLFITAVADPKALSAFRAYMGF